MDNVKVKKSIFKKWWFWVAVIVVIGIIGSTAGDKTPAATVVNDSANKSTATPIPASGATTAPTATPTPEAKTETFKIGDTVKVEEIYYTVNSVRKDKGSDFIKPKEGNIYYIIDTTVENKTDKSFAVSSIMMFKLVDSDGYNYNITIGPDTKGQIDGEIAAGRKLRGELVFEIPKNSKGLELEIDHSLIGSGKVIVKLDR